MLFESKFDIGDKVSYRGYETIYKKCDCCENEYSTNKECIVKGIIKDIRIYPNENNNFDFQYTVFDGYFNMLVFEDKLKLL